MFFCSSTECLMLRDRADEYHRYDSFKIFMGFPTTGGAAPAAEKK